MRRSSAGMSTLLASAVLWLGAIQRTWGIIIDDPADLPLTSFDYVIVGGGTAGLTLANRLTENGATNVLVLEAGRGNEGDLPMPIPFMGPILSPETQYTWNYTVSPQVGLNLRTFEYPRGRVLGGCSSINYLIRQFGTSEDWDRIANLTAEPTWSWANMKQYVQKYDKIVQPLDGHSITGEYIPALHGFGGNVQASLPELTFPIDARVMATLNQPSSEFQYNNDTVGGDQIVLGVGYVHNSSGEGTRSSAYTGYYLAAAARQNFVILTSATVLKLVQTGTTANGLKSFRSVQYAHGTLTLTVTATREVILSAGAINTPQILQLSGIGNAVDLRKLNITVLINNPAVGSNLYDHTLLPNIFVVQDAVANQTFDDLLRNQAQIEDQVNLWIANRTGLFINNIVNHFGFSRITLDPGEEDPAPGPNSPHYEMIFANLFFEKPGPFRPDEGSYFTVGTMLTSPESTGTVKLASADPLAPPIIDPRYLTEAFDIIAMRESVKAVLRFTAAPAWSDWIAGRFGAAFQNATDDASIDAYVRTLTISDMNPVGTASMSMVDDPSGVVDPDLLVKGADGLRIVDASVFPRSPSTHSQGLVYLLAERTADIIKAAQVSSQPPTNQCNANLLCCSNTETANNASSLLALLGITVSDGNTIVGLGCTPINVISVSGNTCTGQVVCCATVESNGLAAINCSPVNLPS